MAAGTVLVASEPAAVAWHPVTPACRAERAIRTNAQPSEDQTNEPSSKAAGNQASKLFCSSPLNPCSEVLVHLHKAADDAMTLRVLIRVSFSQAEQRRQTSSPRFYCIRAFVLGGPYYSSYLCSRFFCYIVGLGLLKASSLSATGFGDSIAALLVVCGGLLG